MSDDVVYLGMVAAALQRESWMDDANCLGAPAELFFVEDNHSGSYPHEAKKFCQSCTVTAECLIYGMDEPHGVFGSTTVNERNRMRGGRRRDTRSLTAWVGRSA